MKALAIGAIVGMVIAIVIVEVIVFVFHLEAPVAFLLGMLGGAIGSVGGMGVASEWSTR